MSTYLQSYRVGTLSVANGSTSVTGTTTLWSANVLAGDLIIVGSTLAEVASVESNTALTLVSGWTGTTVTGSAYVIHRWSRGWLQAGTTALLLADYVSRIPTFIPTTGAPSDAVGSPGNIAVDTSANVFYVKGATTWGSAVSMVGPAGELTRLDAVAGGDIAAWTGTNSAQIRKATAAEIRAAAGGILTRLDAVAGGDIAAWTGTNSEQIRKATAAEVRTAAGSGAYAAGTSYLAGDVVTHQSAGWLARIDTTGVAPPTLPTETSTQWQLIGKGGDLTRLDAVAGGDLAAWTGTNSAQIRKATAAEVRTAAGSIREPLTAARTYYVRPDGNNANDGLTNSAGGAKQTIAGALAAAYAIDAMGFNVTINIAAGTWNENISIASVIPGLNILYLVGAGENSTIIGANTGPALQVSVPIRYQVQNMTLGAAGGGNSVGLWGRYGAVGYLTGGNVGFNALTARAVAVDAGGYIESTSGEIRLRGNTPSAFYLSAGASATLTSGCTVKTMSPITCAGGFAKLLSASATITPTFDLTAGAVTGPRYSVSRCGALSVNGGGANFLPGSTAGTVDAVSYYG